MATLPKPTHSPLFSVVEVEINAQCNRSCSYCPVSILPKAVGARYMARALFVHLLGQLAAISFSGRLSYHIYNEPLLRRDLELLITDARKHLPLAHQILYTNGDRLTPARHASLTSSGIEHFVVTRHDSKPFTLYDNATILTPHQLDLTNRGGFLRHVGVADEAHRRHPCFAPSEMLIVTVTGDVLLCYEDAQRQHVFGNITDKSIVAIWNDPAFVLVREHLVSGRRSGARSICAECTNLAHISPGRSWFAL